jgi:hypothetical protein
MHCTRQAEAPGSVRLIFADSGYESEVIILGIVLLILGAVLNIPILWTLGVILVVIGVILFILGSLGRGVGGRRYYW